MAAAAAITAANANSKCGANAKYSGKWQATMVLQMKCQQLGDGIGAAAYVQTAMQQNGNANGGAINGVAKCNARRNAAACGANGVVRGK